MEVEEDLDIHYYVLYCQSLKIEKLYYVFNNQKDVEAFIPRYEKYIRSKDKVIINPMFPGYLFIKTSKNQIEFDTMLTLMYEQKDGVIKELKKDEVSALTKDEIHLLHLLLNKHYILKISKGYKKDGRLILTEGPLMNLQEHITAIIPKDHLAILNIKFLNRKIKAGLETQIGIYRVGVAAYIDYLNIVYLV